MGQPDICVGGTYRRGRVALCGLNGWRWTPLGIPKKPWVILNMGIRLIWAHDLIYIGKGCRLLLSCHPQSPSSGSSWTINGVSPFLKALYNYCYPILSHLTVPSSWMLPQAMFLRYRCLCHYNFGLICKWPPTTSLRKKVVYNILLRRNINNIIKRNRNSKRRILYPTQLLFVKG